MYIYIYIYRRKFFPILSGEVIILHERMDSQRKVGTYCLHTIRDCKEVNHAGTMTIYPIYDNNSNSKGIVSLPAIGHPYLHRPLAANYLPDSNRFKPSPN